MLFFYKKYSLLFRVILCSILIGVLFLPSITKIYAASSPWSQTDWVGGSGQTAWSDTTKFDSSSNVTTSAANQVTLTNTEKFTNTGFESDLTGWTTAASTLGNNVAGYWKMDESSWNGTTGEVIDASGNANNGTAIKGITGTSTGSNTSTTLNNTGAGWSTNQFATATITITSGNDSGDIKTIVSNTSQQVTISSPWALTPNASSTYTITTTFPTTVAGKIGNAGSFNGISQGVVIPSSSSLNNKI
jgi:hypothetical protein